MKKENEKCSSNNYILAHPKKLSNLSTLTAKKKKGMKTL